METSKTSSDFFQTFYRSYPTYEEWKQLRHIYDLSQEDRSYPTYEEWKQVKQQSYELGETPFLSYLWGMETMMKNLRSMN